MSHKTRNTTADKISSFPEITVGATDGSVSQKRWDDIFGKKKTKKLVKKRDK